MGLFKFIPKIAGANPASGPAGSRGRVAMVSGQTYEVDAGWAEFINTQYEGIEGDPALVPVVPKAAPAAAAAPNADKPAKGSKANPHPVAADPSVETT